MAQELEIKLTLNSGVMDAAFAWLSAQPQATAGLSTPLVNIYYDTPEASLSQQKAALRIRQKSGDYIQTVKTRGRFAKGMHQREEWEWPLAGGTLNLELLADTPLGEGVELAQLAPVFETNFNRQIVMIDDGEAIIECALDSGDVIAGQQRRPLNEVEFELKSGDPQRLLVWAARLAQECPVFLNLISKAEQGYYLAGLYSPKVTGAQSDAVIALFQRLGAAWLTGSKVDLDGLDRAELAAVAERKAVTDPFQQLMDQLHQGIAFSALMEQPAFGQLQLALLL